MKMGCWTSFGRFILIAMNSVILIVATAIIAVGVVLNNFKEMLMAMLFGAKDIADTLGNDTMEQFNIPDLQMITELPFVDQAGTALIIFGGFLFVLSFLPCCGAGCQWRPLLVLYVILMGLLVLCQVVVGGMFLSKHSPLHETLKTELGNRVKDAYVPDGKDPFSFSIDLLNYLLGCCGIRGWEDFPPPTPRPPSCCNSTITDGDDSWEWARDMCVADPPTAPDSFYNSKGCYALLQDAVLSDMTMAVVGLAAFILFQLLEIIFACMIVKDLNDKNKVSPWD